MNPYAIPTLNFAFHIPRLSRQLALSIVIQELRGTTASRAEHGHGNVLDGNIPVPPAQIKGSPDIVLLRWTRKTGQLVKRQSCS